MSGFGPGASGGEVRDSNAWIGIASGARVYRGDVSMIGKGMRIKWPQRDQVMHFPINPDAVSLDFTSRKELEAQTGHEMAQWACVVAKELADNALDACEEAGTAPRVAFAVDTRRGSITVSDNGPGLPPETVTSILDFTTRTSSREAYVGPTRGAQGNALKTLLAIPYVLRRENGDETEAAIIIEARGVRHHITLSEDAVQAATPAADPRRWAKFRN